MNGSRSGIGGGGDGGSGSRGGGCGGGGGGSRGGGCGGSGSGCGTGTATTTATTAATTAATTTATKTFTLLIVALRRQLEHLILQAKPHEPWKQNFAPSVRPIPILSYPIIQRISHRHSDFSASRTRGRRASMEGAILLLSIMLGRVLLSWHYGPQWDLLHLLIWALQWLSSQVNLDKWALPQGLMATFP